MNTHESRRTYAEGRHAAPQTAVWGLALALVFGFALAGCDNGTGDPDTGDPNFTIENGVLKKYNGPGGAVTIPDGVKEIVKDAFSGCNTLTSVNIPASVTGITLSAFVGCTGLTAFTVASGNTKYKAVDGVLLEKLSAESADYDYLYLYPAGKQGAYTIPEGVTGFSSYTFSGCTNLTSVTIPAGVTDIGFYNPFEGCTALTAFTVDSGNTKYKAVDGVLFELYTPTAHYLRSYPAGKQGVSYEIPQEVSNIAYGAFAGCTALTTFTVAAGNTTYKAVDGVLFELDTLSEIFRLVAYPAGKQDSSYTIPDKATVIEEKAFYGCVVLTTVTITEKITSIGTKAFYGCSGLTTVTFEGDKADISMHVEDVFPGDYDAMKGSYGKAKKGTYTRSGTSPNYTWTGPTS